MITGVFISPDSAHIAFIDDDTLYVVRQGLAEVEEIDSVPHGWRTIQHSEIELCDEWHDSSNGRPEGPCGTPLNQDGACPEAVKHVGVRSKAPAIAPPPPRRCRAGGPNGECGTRLDSHGQCPEASNHEPV